MVTTGTNAVSAVTGQAGAPQMGEGAASGQDDSEFSQLLGGMSGDAAETTVVANAKPIKAALSDTDNVTTDAAGLSAEMLALCGVPMTAPTPMPIPALIAADPTGPQAMTSSSATQIAMNSSTAKPSAVAATDRLDAASLNQPVPVGDTVVTTDPGASNLGANNSTASSAVTAQDMQWLRSGNQVVANAANVMKQDSEIKPAAANSAATTAAPAAGPDASTLLPDSTGVQSDRQGAYQQIFAQTMPMVATSVGQRHEQEIEDADTSSAQADGMTAVNTLSAQPVGTQLATDSFAIDNVRHQIHAPVGTHQWATELGNKLTMLASKDTQSATLYMTPADLGPIQVRIDLHQNQASVWFTAEQADTRSALEQSLPRLRDMFTAQGMSLTDAGVFGDRPRQQSNYGDANSGVLAGTHFSIEESGKDTSLVRSISLSMLDAYA